MSGERLSPERLRAWAQIVKRDILSPLVGTFLAIYLPVSHQFAAWQIPLFMGLFGFPFVAPRKPKDRQS